MGAKGAFAQSAVQIQCWAWGLWVKLQLTIMSKKLQKGFTLIELLVVIAIIGILSSVVLVSLNNARAKARDSSRQANLQSIATAAALYTGDQAGGEVAPIYTTAGCPNGWNSNCISLTGGNPTFSGYLKQLPAEGTAANSWYYYATTTGLGDEYKYCLGARLENPSSAGGYGFLCNSGGCFASSSSFTKGLAWSSTSCPAN